MSVTKTDEFTCVEVQMAIEINAPVETVWAALTTNLTDWWPKDFIIGGPSATLTFDAVPGGLMKETWPGGGLVWGQVMNMVENQVLQTAGDLFAEFGGPARAHITYKLEATDTGTTLHLTDVTFGKVSDTMADSKTQGWDFLLAQTMKAWCEKRV